MSSAQFVGTLFFLFFLFVFPFLLESGDPWFMSEHYPLNLIRHRASISAGR